MSRREFITLIGGAAASFVSGPLAARAQPAERLRRIGVLMSTPASDPDAQLRIAAFRKGMRDLGWVEGRNYRIELRWAAGDADLMRNLAKELVQMAPDLILANSTPVTVALREQGHSVPVVFVQVTDPVGQGLVASLARPGGNLTGFTSFEFSIGSKWLEMLKVVAPQVTRVALIFNPETAPYAGLFRQPVEAAAPAFDVTPMMAAARDAGEIERVVDALARQPGGGLMVLPDVTTMNHRDLIIALAARHRLPAIYPFRYFAASGGLLSYGTDVADVFRRAASYADRILKGARAGELPVQAPSKLELVMNVGAAKALGIAMPPLLLARADEVIE
jgi:putative tryptophan/tyrosine transport system substrate-binding protein